METQSTTLKNTGSHRAVIDTTRTKSLHILQVVANPTRSTTTGWPVGFWAAELSHPYYEFTEAGYEVTIASPNGGTVEVDALSDPRDPSKWSADDLISMGFLNTPELVALLENTPKLSMLDYNSYDALVICGGQSPMFTFRNNTDLHNAIRTFYEVEKPVAAFCHGVAALVDATLSDGSYLVTGKTVTGFANVEEDYSDRAAGTRIMPWRLEDALKERGANYVQAGLFKQFAIRDGRLITGQQQYSGRKVAQLMIAALGQ
jgi:putative intracellular protease/amidase